MLVLLGIADWAPVSAAVLNSHWLCSSLVAIAHRSFCFLGSFAAAVLVLLLGIAD